MPDGQNQVANSIADARKMGVPEDSILQHLQSSRGIDPGAIAHLTKALGSTAKVNDYLVSVPKPSASPAVQQTGGAVAPPEQQAQGELKATPMTGAPGLVSEDPAKEAAEAQQVKQAGGIKAEPLAPVGTGLGTQALASGISSGAQKYVEERQKGKGILESAESGAIKGAEVGGATLVGGKVLSKAVPKLMQLPSDAEAAEKVANTLKDMTDSGQTVNVSKGLNEYAKTLDPAASKKLWDTVGQVRKATGIMKDYLDPVTAHKFAENLYDAFSGPNAKEQAFMAATRYLRTALPENIRSFYMQLGPEARVLNAPVTQAASSAGSSIAKTAAKVAAGAGSGFLASRAKSAASYAVNRLGWELSSKAWEHLLGK